MAECILLHERKNKKKKKKGAIEFTALLMSVNVNSGIKDQQTAAVSWFTSFLQNRFNKRPKAMDERGKNITYKRISRNDKTPRPFQKAELDATRKKKVQRHMSGVTSILISSFFLKYIYNFLFSSQLTQTVFPHFV